MERSLGEDELERERVEFGFEANCENPVYKNAAKEVSNKMKTRVRISGKKINPLGQFKIRPSGWIQRAGKNTVTESSLKLRLEFCKGSGWMDF